MAVFAGPPAGYALKRAREEAFSLAYSRTCDSCGADRMCARLEPLAVEARWYCGECWDYQLGRTHGRRQAVEDLRQLVDNFSLTLR